MWRLRGDGGLNEDRHLIQEKDGTFKGCNGEKFDSGTCT